MRICYSGRDGVGMGVSILLRIICYSGQTEWAHGMHILRTICCSGRADRHKIK
jgi:hypothetical protein